MVGKSPNEIESYARVIGSPIGNKCDVPSEKKYSNLFTGKNTGFPREFTGTHRDLPGFTGKFTGMYRKVSWDISLLWIHWEIPGSAGELTEKARDLPEYRDGSPVFHR